MALMNGVISLHVGQGQGSWLRAFNGYAVTSLSEEDPWHIHASPNNPNEFTLTYDGNYDLALTLGKEDDGNPNEITIIIKPLDDPPTREQLWTFEKAMGPPTHPPRMMGWLQSCARPDLSASVGGHVPLPRIFLPVSAVANEKARQNPNAARWYANYRSVD